MINHAKKVRNQADYDHVVLRYNNRKLYLIEEGFYISYDDLIGYIRNSESFVVFDDLNGGDITDMILRAVLAKVVKDQELVPIDPVINLLIKYLKPEVVTL